MKHIQNTIKDQSKIAYIFCSFSALILCSVVFYVYLINMTVLNIVTRQNDEAKISKVISDVSQLENQNIALNSMITPEYAIKLGFSDPVDPQYITYTGPGGSGSTGSVAAVSGGSLSLNAR